MSASPAPASSVTDPAHIDDDGAHDEMTTVAPKQLSEQELADGLRQLRTDFRTAAIAHVGARPCVERHLPTRLLTLSTLQFSVLFLHHLGGTFNTDVRLHWFGTSSRDASSSRFRTAYTQDFELDLLGVQPGAQVPALLGKILNTLANDRNCKWVLAESQSLVMPFFVLTMCDPPPLARLRSFVDPSSAHSSSNWCVPPSVYPLLLFPSRRTKD